MITLVISDNEGTTTRVPLVLDEVSIGRKEGNTIRLTERNISRDHCRIARIAGDGADYLVRDLGSYNGVIVNGQRIENELRIKPGDELRIGDYTVALEAEVKTEIPAAPRTSQVPGAKGLSPVPPAPRTPARLVVLTAPLAGAEFSLPEQGHVRVGRAGDLEIAIDHRSVSREHAVIKVESGRIRIADQGSANGLVVNQDKVQDALLAAGDLIELGDVVVRFCAAGEKYVFDPIEARALVASRRPRARWHVWGAAAIIAAALLGALWIVRSPSETPHAVVSPESASPASPASSDKTAVPAAAAAALATAANPAAEVDHVPELVASCRSAIEGGRFAEGVAHASAALKLKPDSPEALACETTARTSHEQEQIYVRGSAALETGDVEGAWSELVGLDDAGAVAHRPEVQKIVETVAGRVLDRAQQLARKDQVQAAALARSVIERASLSSALHERAQTLLAKVDKPAATPPAHAARNAEPKEKEPREPKESHPATAHTRTPAAPAGAPAMETASACLARGDNQCVIRALAGKAQTAQELGLLIETYRAVGESTLAYRSMTTYVQRFPTARRADAYRALLSRQGQ